MKSNLSSEETTNFLIEQYINKGKSTYEIAEQLNTYPNKVRRLLVKAGVELRNKSTAQSNAITTGRHKHPTKGTTRSEEDKIKISDGMYNHWSNKKGRLKQKNNGNPCRLRTGKNCGRQQRKLSDALARRGPKWKNSSTGS